MTTYAIVIKTPGEVAAIILNNALVKSGLIPIIEDKNVVILVSTKDAADKLFAVIPLEFKPEIEERN